MHFHSDMFNVMKGRSVQGCNFWQQPCALSINDRYSISRAQTLQILGPGLFRLPIRNCSIVQKPLLTTLNSLAWIGPQHSSPPTLQSVLGCEACGRYMWKKVQSKWNTRTDFVADLQTWIIKQPAKPKCILWHALASKRLTPSPSGLHKKGRPEPGRNSGSEAGPAVRN